MCNRLQLCAVAGLLLALACTNSAESDSNPDLEVYSWWASAGEEAAFEALVTPFKLEHPGARVENVDRDTALEASIDLGGLLLLGVPPNSFQANAGTDLLRWAAVDYESVASGAPPAAPVEEGFSLLADLGPLLQETGALDAMYPEVRRAVCARIGDEQRYFGVPVNVHRINLLYFNRERVQQSGSTADQLFTIEKFCPAALGGDVLPFEISIAAGDTLSLLLLTFENLLLGVGGPGAYLGFFAGEPASVWRPQMERALGCLWHMSRSFKIVDHWALAVHDVETLAVHDVETTERGAMMTVMGDWANPEVAASLRESVVGRMPFPDTGSYFAFTSDSFPQPLEARSPEHTRSLLRSFAELDTQLAFSAAKGSIPALRQSGAPANLDAWALESLQAFEDPGKIKVLATSGLFPSFVSQPRVTEELKALTGVKAVSDVPMTIQRILDLLESNLPLFRTWRARLEACE